MKSSIAIAVALVLAGCQTAQLEKPEPGEPERALANVPTLSGEALKSYIAGKALSYNYYGAVSTYAADGTYRYKDYEVRDHGTWSISGDEVCITFDDGGNRCDQFALIGSDYFRIEAGGRQTKVDRIGPA